MSKRKESSTKVEETDYIYCDRCKIDNLGKGNRMCPCPRGGCEAEVVGKIKTTIELTVTPVKPLDKTKTQYASWIEEMNCPTCKAVTGHAIKGKHWTCIHCDTPLK